MQGSIVVQNKSIDSLYTFYQDESEGSSEVLSYSAEVSK